MSQWRLTYTGSIGEKPGLGWDNGPSERYLGSRNIPYLEGAAAALVENQQEDQWETTQQNHNNQTKPNSPLLFAGLVFVAVVVGAGIAVGVLKFVKRRRQNPPATESLNLAENIGTRPSYERAPTDAV
eukprot:TRINITY_DN58647_c0_g1_i1.p1 TRINITY_DN58647_c0_g1~~TRINITY_DN58647_c0_g1_i1.p1  ORF type:complete len:128 (-),score=9.78 TRINITY_DN58647_c0_g1_i1:134-517(-)